MAYNACNAYNPYITPDPHFIPGFFLSIISVRKEVGDYQISPQVSLPNITTQTTLHGFNPYSNRHQTVCSRYTGYCPRRKFQLGKTYGHETHEALSTSRQVPTTVPRMDPSGEVELDPTYLVQNRLASQGDVKLREDMWPGYTGGLFHSI
ncbi:FAM166B [Cordylochernes scorpioides]|uniref:FAM166B n=1 Tax=Cordylochernes scorpioides TaxID=51811 RepID=A0ABY6KSE5_9ARAC|nr:FAM166B [Cordylochernes scorpioides]